MSSDEDFVAPDDEEEVAPSDDMEAARVARYFLYKHRERLSVKKAQLRTVTDNAKQSSKKGNVITRANKILENTLGYSIVDYIPEGAKAGSKLYLVRKENYPNDIQLPFQTKEKKIYGLLFFVFLHLHFKNGKCDLESLQQVIDAAGANSDVATFGHWPDIVHLWARQEYIKEKKRDTDQGPKIEISYGNRFYVEYGEDLIVQLGKELIKDNDLQGDTPATSQFTLPSSSSMEVLN